MATYDAGDARLQIFPDATGFKAKLEADLQKLNIDIKVPVHPNLAQATADLDRWRAQQQRNAVDLKVNVDTDNVTAKVRAAKSEIGGLQKVLSDLNLGQNGIGSGLKFNAAALGIGSLPAAAAAVGTLASAVQQLAGAGAVLPGALAGIGVTVATIKVGVSGVADAFTALDKASDGTAKSIAASNKLLAGLAPSAAEAVKAGVEIKKQLTDALVKPTQQNLFDGLAASAHKLVDADLPVVQRGMAGLSTALNGTAKQLLSSLGSDSSKGFLDQIFGNTTDAQARLSKAIDPAVHAFGQLAATGSAALPRLADGVGKLADRFNNFITKADADGSLSKWIDDGLTGVSHLGDTALNIGKVFTSIATAAGGGDGLLGTLDNLTGKLSTFLASDQGQQDLKNFFQEGRDQLKQWLPIVENIGKSLPAIFDGARTWTNAVLPPLQAVTGILSSMPNLITDVTVALVAWKSIDGVASLVGKIGGVGKELDTLPGKAEKSAGGIKGAFSKLNLGNVVGAGAIAALTAGQTSSMIGGDNSAASDAGGLGLNVAGGAAAGALVGGAPGAIVGAIVGMGTSIYQRVLADINEGRRQFESQSNDPTRPGSPENARVATGTENVFQPSLANPTINASLLPAIRAGQVKGFSVGPDGQTIINTATGQPVNVPGLNLAPAPPAPPAPPPAPKPVPTSAGVPFPVAPPAAPTQAPTGLNPSPAPTVTVQNPITAGTTIAAKVDPAAQASVDTLAKSIQSLPAGEVKITDGSPQVLDAVKKLDVQVTSLKDHPGEVVVHANTEEAQTKLDALIRNFQSRIITIQVNPSMGALPVAPGKKTGGINGILPGYSPGVDNMLVPMSGGEGVIIPQVAKELGPEGVDAINRGALTASKRGYSIGGVVDKNGNPINVGAAPGPGGFVPGAGPAPIAPNGADGGGGAGGIFGSILSGLGGPLGNIANLAGGAAGAATGGTGFTSTGSFMDRLAGVPGIAGLIGSAGSSNPDAALGQWGGSTGKWLGSFAAKTIGGFGNALWQGGLDAIGLGGSILSPSNPWFQDIAKVGGAQLGPDSLLGNLLGGGNSSTSSATAKQVREGGQKITKADQKVAGIIQKIKELKPSASQSSRNSLRDQLLNAQQDASDARADFSTLTGGMDPAAAQAAAQQQTDPNATSHHGGPGTLTPMSGGEGIIDPAIAAQLGPDGVAAINAGKLPKGFKDGGILPTLNHGFAGGMGLVPLPSAAVFTPHPAPSAAAARAAVAQPITSAPRGSAQIPGANTKQLPSPITGPAAPSAPGAPPAPSAPPPPSSFVPGTGPGQVGGAAPTGDGLNHNLAAINTGISSAASAIGSAVSMAAGVAGGSGFAPGAGAIGQIAAGAIQEGGKVVSDLVNVGSSFLVGSVPGNLGGAGPAQGETLTSAQNVPDTAQDNRRSYNIQAGYKPSDLIDAIQLKEAQDHQADLARFRY